MHKRNFHIISLNFNNLKSSISRIHRRHCHNTLHSIYCWWLKTLFHVDFYSLLFLPQFSYFQYVMLCSSISLFSLFQYRFSVSLNRRLGMYTLIQRIESSMVVECSGRILSYDIGRITGNATKKLNQVHFRKWVFLLNFT